MELSVTKLTWRESIRMPVLSSFQRSKVATNLFTRSTDEVFDKCMLLCIAQPFCHEGRETAVEMEIRQLAENLDHPEANLPKWLGANYRNGVWRKKNIDQGWNVTGAICHATRETKRITWWTETSMEWETQLLPVDSNSGEVTITSSVPVLKYIVAAVDVRRVIVVA